MAVKKKIASSAYLLSEGEKQEYADYLNAAFKEATQYNGSEKSLNQLIKVLSQPERFVRKHNNGKISEALEETFADQAKPELSQTQPVKLADIMVDAGERYFQKLRDAGDLSETFKLMANGNAAIVHSNATFIQSDKIDAQSDFDAHGGTSNDNRRQTETQPRVAWLMEGLKSIGIYADDVIFRVGKNDAGMRRENPYIIMEIPRLQKQIAVNNEVGQVTFVSKEILGSKVYETLTKKQLKSLSCIEDEPCRNKSTWLKNILGHLVGGPTHEHDPKNNPKKINVKAYAKKSFKRSFPLSEYLIVESARATQEASPDGRIPSARDTLIEHGPLAGIITWGAVHVDLVRGRRGLPGGSTLSQCLMKHGLRDKKIEITKDKIWECVQLHRKKFGHWPEKRMEDSIEFKPLKGRTWVEADSYLKQRESSLFQFITQKRIKLAGDIFTADNIWNSIKDHHEKTNQWPMVSSGVIQGGPLKDQEWDLVNTILKQGNKHLPGKSNLQEFIDERRLRYTRENILESAKLHFEETGHWPHDKSGEIEFGPLKCGNWGSADNALRNGNQHLPKGSSLHLLLVKEGLKANNWRSVPSGRPSAPHRTPNSP